MSCDVHVTQTQGYLVPIVIPELPDPPLPFSVFVRTYEFQTVRSKIPKLPDSQVVSLNHQGQMYYQFGFGNLVPTGARVVPASYYQIRDVEVPPLDQPLSLSSLGRFKWRKSGALLLYSHRFDLGDNRSNLWVWRQLTSQNQIKVKGAWAVSFDAPASGSIKEYYGGFSTVIGPQSAFIDRNYQTYADASSDDETYYGEVEESPPQIIDVVVYQGEHLITSIPLVLSYGVIDPDVPITQPPPHKVTEYLCTYKVDVFLTFTLTLFEVKYTTRSGKELTRSFGIDFSIPISGFTFKGPRTPTWLQDVVIAFINEGLDVTFEVIEGVVLNTFLPGVAAVLQRWTDVKPEVRVVDVKCP